VEWDTCHSTAVKHKELQFLKTRKKLKVGKVSIWYMLRMTNITIILL